MRTFVGGILILLASFVVGPSSQELHNRYGEPTMERFTARPGVSVAVEYGPDRLACLLSIEPPQSLIHQEEQAVLMPSESVSEVLEEVAPAAARGQEVTSADFVSGCNVSHLIEYETAYILRSVHTCDPSSKDQDLRTTVTFKRSVCPSNTPPAKIKK